MRRTLLACLLAVFTNTLPAVHAEPLDTVVGTLKHVGLPAFYDQTMEASPLKLLISPAERESQHQQLLSVVHTSSVSDIDSERIAFGGQWFVDFLVVHYRHVSFLLSVASEADDYKRAFAVNWRDIGKGGISDVIRPYWTVLPRGTPDAQFVEDMSQALRTTIRDRDFVHMDDLEKRLAEGRPTLPSYVAARADSAERRRPRANAIFGQVDLDPHIQYVWTKLVTRQLGVSLFLTKSSFGPAVFAVYHQMIDELPAIIGGEFLIGEPVLTFAPDLGAARATDQP